MVGVDHPIGALNSGLSIRELLVKHDVELVPAGSPGDDLGRGIVDSPLGGGLSVKSLTSLTDMF